MSDKITITICGDGGCGKSSITLRLVRSQWTHEYDPTIEDFYSVTRTIDGRPYQLYLTDTAGQEEYRSMWAASNLASDAFLLVYDLTNPDSLQDLGHYIEMIDIEIENRIEENLSLLKGDGGELGEDEKKLVKPMPVKIVAGNKCDLKAERRVTARHGLEWSRRRGCGFMETSAREMVNIEETFALIVRRVVEARRHSSLNPYNPHPFSSSANVAARPAPTKQDRTSIMNLTTKKKALKAMANGPLSASPPTSDMVSLSQTPALAPPTAAEEEKEAQEREYVMNKGESTRLDGRPVRKKSILGKGAGWLARLTCWKR